MEKQPVFARRKPTFAAIHSRIESDSLYYFGDGWFWEIAFKIYGFFAFDPCISPPHPRKLPISCVRKFCVWKRTCPKNNLVLEAMLLFSNRFINAFQTRAPCSGFGGKKLVKNGLSFFIERNQFIFTRTNAKCSGRFHRMNTVA